MLVSLLQAISSTFVAPSDCDRPEWRSEVYSSTPLALWYRISPWGYSIVGVLLIVFSDDMSFCDSGLWWRAIGIGLCVQGLLSYLSDVWSWGRRDRAAGLAKALDPVLASTLFAIVGPLICYRMAVGLFSLPSVVSRTWMTGCVLAVASKVMGAQEMQKRNPIVTHYLAWHGCGWHGLPVVAMYCIMGVVQHARSA